MLSVRYEESGFFSRWTVLIHEEANKPCGESQFQGGASTSMHGRADTTPILATRARPVSPCAAHSAPVSIPVDKQLRGPMDAQQPTNSEVFEFEERCWIMYERLSRAGLRVLDPETSTSLDHQAVALNSRLCGLRFSRSNPEGVLRSLAVGMPIARTSHPLNASPTDVRFLPLHEDTELFKENDNNNPAAPAADVIETPLFVVDL